MGDPRLLLVAVCALNQMGIDDMLAAYCLERAECTTFLLRLEALGVLELHPNDRIRLNVSALSPGFPTDPSCATSPPAPGTISTIPSQLRESMRIVTVRVSTAAAVALVARLEQIAREYSNSTPPTRSCSLADRPALSVCLAVRHWEPPEFRALARE